MMLSFCRPLGQRCPPERTPWDERGRVHPVTSYEQTQCPQCSREQGRRLPGFPPMAAGSLGGCLLSALQEQGSERWSRDWSGSPRDSPAVSICPLSPGLTLMGLGPPGGPPRADALDVVRLQLHFLHRVFKPRLHRSNCFYTWLESIPLEL